MQHQHVIGQLTVEIQGATIATAADYQRACSQQIRSDRFMSVLNQVLDQVQKGDGVLQIPRIELDLQYENDEQFGAAFLEAFRDAIRQHADISANKIVPVEKNVATLALYFLEHGTLPWSATLQQKSAVQSLLFSAEFAEISEFLYELEQKAAQNPHMWQRLLYAAGLKRTKDLLRFRYGFDSELLLWLESLIPAQAKGTSQGTGLDSALQHTAITAMPTMYGWYLALQYRVLGTQDESLFKEKIREKFVSSLEATERQIARPGRLAPQDIVPQMIEDLPFESAVFIQNAGLVLLAQFFPILFQRAGLVENSQFVDAAAGHQAVQLLQYLLTGEDQAWEHELLLNKILCDMPDDMPIDRFADLSKVQRREADLLLTEAIRQWTVLKNTSVQSLREMFLERDGKLTRNGRNWRLQVERKAVDVLLERLPMGWGYSVIKLPWMEGVLYVEW